jgi:hypothetical protein
MAEFSAKRLERENRLNVADVPNSGCADIKPM